MHFSLCFLFLPPACLPYYNRVTTFQALRKSRKQDKFDYDAMLAARQNHFV